MKKLKIFLLIIIFYSSFSNKAISLEIIRDVELENFTKKIVSSLVKDSEIDIGLGREQLVIQRKYDAAGALNDLMIALWFLIGSIFFLDDNLMRTGTWLFVIGSAQFLLKPLIKLIGLIHMRRFTEPQNPSDS